MNSNTIKTYALIGTSVVSVVLLYRNFHLAGIIEDLRKTRKKAVNSALEYSQNVYLDRVNKLLETCEKQETPSDDLKAILDLMDCPL